MGDYYDFIVVGGGPSGCAIASRIARSNGKPSVLLLEAGSENEIKKHQVSGERFQTFMTAEGYNWGFKTVPQKQLKGQQIDYSRGKGLGGSTAINFLVFLRGAADDYDEWARRVDDDIWSWENTKQRFNELETFHGEVSKPLQGYIQPRHDAHGHRGPLHLEFAGEPEKGLAEYIAASREFGYPLNLDLNSGNPLGTGIPASTAYCGRRITAAKAFLFKKPDNLTIVTHASIGKVIFEGKKAVGVESLDEKKFYASKDVILSAGALDTPKILLLSGVGPADNLENLGIPVVHDLPGVGQGLRDHCFSPITILQKPGTNERAEFYSNPKAMQAAKEQWEKDGTGRFAHFYCAAAVSFLRNKGLRQSPEYRDLPPATREFLELPTIPDYEVATHTPPLFVNADEELKPTDTYLSVLVFVMNPQSTGSVQLHSKDPKDQLLIDPQFLSHPFDRRAAIEAMRTTLEMIEMPSLKKDTIKLVGGPKSSSDEDILDYTKKSLFSSWHMCGTAKMGKPSDSTACVNKDFQVIGVQNLRVVDMSIAPLITNNHTQSTAYLIGLTAGDKLIAEYGLDTQTNGTEKGNLKVGG